MTLHNRTRFAATLFAVGGLCLLALFLSIANERVIVQDQLMALREASVQAAGLRLAAEEFSETSNPVLLQDARGRTGDIRRWLDSIAALHVGGDVLMSDPARWRQAQASLERVERLLRQDLPAQDQAAAETIAERQLAARFQLESGRLETDLDTLHAPWTRVLERWDWMARTVAYVFAATFLALLVVLVRLLESHILRPLYQLMETVTAVSGGQLKVRVGMQRQDEIGALARAFDGMLDRLQDSTVSRASLKAEVLERRHTESALRHSEERLHLALKAARAGIWEWNIVTGAASWSAECFELFGVDSRAGAPDYDAWLELILAEDRPRVRAAMDEVLASGTEWNMEFRIQHSRLGVRWLLSAGNIEYREDGALLGLSGINLDITERKSAEQALRERLEIETRLTRIAAHTPGMLHTFRQRPDGSVCFPYASPAIEDIFGLDAAEVANEGAPLFALVHPEDLPHLMQSNADCGRLMAPWHTEFRVNHPARGEVWVEIWSAPQPEADGSLLWYGYLHDITERKHREMQLRLLGQVFAQSPEGIMVTDRENRIVIVNAAFSALNGYEPGDVLGRNPNMLASGRTTRHAYAEMWHAIQERGYWEGELWDKRKNGTCYPKWLRISALRDEQGAISHYVGHFNDITERKAAEEKIHHLAHHDTLTGLLNRFSLRLRLEQAIAEARRTGEELAVMFIDMDRFKAINDSLGHDMGDRVLMEVASRLRSSVRDTDLVARLGGDEFVVVLTGVTTAKTNRAITKAPNIVRRLAKAYRFDGRKLNTTPSVGVSLFPVDGEDADTLMKNADTAMYHAKARGRNNVQFFSAAMNQAVVERLQLEQALRQADPRKDFFLHYQPQLSAGDARVVGFEALVRWEHPELGLVPPDRFIPVAEDTGVIEPLGMWVLETACDQLWKLKSLGWPHPRMAVNLSVRQLRHPELAALLTRLIQGYELGAEELELEITESAAMEDPEATIAVLNQFRGMRIALAIDDFGTGYSSLAHLKRLPIQRLKLDRSFVRDIESDPNDAHICRATIALAHSLGLEVVAEGVETEAQLRYLTDLGCDVIQGYYYSRPMAARDAEAFLVQHLQMPPWQPAEMARRA